MVNFGILTAEIDSRVWGTPAYLNGYRVLASLLQRRCSTEVNQTLNNVWPSPWLLQYTYTFGGCCPLTEFCQLQNSLCLKSCVLLFLTALLHGTGTVGVKQTLRRCTRYGITELWQNAPPRLYSAERPSRWKSAHFLVQSVSMFNLTPCQVSLPVHCAMHPSWGIRTYESRYTNDRFFCRLLAGSRPSDHHFRSVCLSASLSVCLFVCAEFFSAVFDPISIKLGHMLYVWV